MDFAISQISEFLANVTKVAFIRGPPSVAGGRLERGLEVVDVGAETAAATEEVLDSTAAAFDSSGALTTDSTDLTASAAFVGIPVHPFAPFRISPEVGNLWVEEEEMK